MCNTGARELSIILNGLPGFFAVQPEENGGFSAKKPEDRRGAGKRRALVPDTVAIRRALW